MQLPQCRWRDITNGVFRNHAAVASKHCEIFGTWVGSRKNGGDAADANYKSHVPAPEKLPMPSYPPTNFLLFASVCGTAQFQLFAIT